MKNINEIEDENKNSYYTELEADFDALQSKFDEQEDRHEELLDAAKELLDAIDYHSNTIHDSSKFEQELAQKNVITQQEKLARAVMKLQTYIKNY